DDATADDATAHGAVYDAAGGGAHAPTAGYRGASGDATPGAGPPDRAAPGRRRGARMSFVAFLRVTFAVALLVLLHFTLRPLLGWRAPIDFLVIAALCAAVRLRPGIAALVGLLLGFAADALTPSAFGAGALALSAVAFLASWLKAVFFADNLALSLLFFFGGKWTFDLLYLVAERRVRGTELAMQLLMWSPLAATVTAFAGIVLLLVLRPVLGRSSA
ncbi:MAG: hypothetical protein ACXWZ4_09015, partial [Gemmatirosa sp.]